MSRILHLDTIWLLKLAASMRSRDGCEALSKVRHHEKNQHRRIKCRRSLYALKLTLGWMRQLPWWHSSDFKSIFTLARYNTKLHVKWPTKMIHAHFDGSKQWLSSNIIVIHIPIMMLISNYRPPSCVSWPKIKKYNIWLSRTKYRDSWNPANRIRNSSRGRP